MWKLIVLLAFVVSAYAVLRQLRPVRRVSLTFVAAAIWGRLLLFYFPQIAFKTMAAGQSLMAGYSAGVVAASLLLIRPRQFFSLHLLPFYCLFLIIALSSFLNDSFLPFITETMRWLFFFIILLLLKQNIEEVGRDKVLYVLFLILCVPLFLQLLGVPLGIQTRDAQGATIFLGGYPGIAAFWRLLFSLACICALVRIRSDLLFFFVCFLCLIGIYLTNNRTGMVGTLPIFIMFLYTILNRYFDLSMKIIASVVALTTILFVAPILMNNLPGKYAAINDLIAHVGATFEDPHLLTQEERLAATGRVGIWSQYLYEWRQADAWNKVLGFGPESFSGKLPHNDHIGMLYQFGIAGVVTFTVILVWQIVLILRVPESALRERLLGCFGGFIIITQTTDAVWNLESLIGLAVICAVTWTAQQPVEARSPWPARREPIGARWATNRSVAKATRHR